MISEQLYAGSPIPVAGITLIPIERVQVSSEIQPSAYWFKATKAAVAVIICDREGPRAVDVEMHESPMSVLLTEIPELESLLTEFVPHFKADSGCGGNR